MSEEQAKLLPLITAAELDKIPLASDVVNALGKFTQGPQTLRVVVSAAIAHAVTMAMVDAMTLGKSPKAAQFEFLGEIYKMWADLTPAVLLTVASHLGIADKLAAAIVAAGAEATPEPTQH